MRKFLSIICVTAMLLSFSACGNSRKNDSFDEDKSTVEKIQEVSDVKELVYDQSFEDDHDYFSLKYPSCWEVPAKSGLVHGIRLNVTDEAYILCYRMNAGDDTNKTNDEYVDENSVMHDVFENKNGTRFIELPVSDDITKHLICLSSPYAIKFEFYNFSEDNEQIIIDFMDTVQIKEFEKPTEPPTEPPTPAPTEDPAVVEQEYKSQCQALTYKDLARDRDGLIGTYVTFTGEIIQDAGEGAYRMAVTKEGTYTTYYTDPIMIYYNDNGVGDRILKDDIVTIWGQSGGLYSYETVMGDTVTVPLVYVEYVELVEG